MKTVSLFLLLVLFALVAATMVPEAISYHLRLTMAIFATLVLMLVALLSLPGRKAAKDKTKTEALRPQAPDHDNQAQAEVTAFLAVLQEKGRFVDFLMDDIAAYDNAQVGIAARVVHEGCIHALKEHFEIVPIREENEGAKVTIPAGYPLDAYRFVGRIQGEAPFSGTLVHRGWKTKSVKLPRILKDQGGRLPAIAPAEVELS